MGEHTAQQGAAQEKSTTAVTNGASSLHLHAPQPSLTPPLPRDHMVKLTLAVATLLAVSLAAPRVQAQVQDEQVASLDPTVVAPASQPADAPSALSPTGPSMQAATLSPRLATDAPLEVNAMRRPTRGSGVGLMILGGAALITGAIIGNTPGTIIMVGGAIVGLYGLYVYLDRPTGMEQRNGNAIGLGYSLKTN